MFRKNTRHYAYGRYDTRYQHNGMFRAETTGSDGFTDAELQPIGIQLPRLRNVIPQLSPLVLDNRKVKLGELRKAQVEFKFVEQEGEMCLEVGEVIRLNENESEEYSN